MPLSIVRGIAAEAFGTWNQLGCASGGLLSITASEMEPPGEDGVDCDEVQYNPGGPNQHVIIFRDSGWPYEEDAANVLGFTTVQYVNATGEIVDADMEINSHDFEIVPVPPVVQNAQPIQVDLLSIFTHEAGHFLGLAHSGDLTAMMYAFYAPGAVVQDDDISGICSIYAPDGTRSTSFGPVPFAACDPTPVGGFASQCAPGAPDAGVDSGSAGDSGDPPVGATDGKPTSSVPGAPACTFARGPVRPGGAAALLLAAVGGLALLRRARGPRRATEAAALFFLCTLLLASVAGASVAIAVTLSTLVARSQGVAVVTPLERTAEAHGGRIFTWTRARVERVVAGALPGEIWIRTRGGVVGPIGESVEGEADLAVGQPSLVFLRPHAPGAGEGVGVRADAFVIVERAQGQFGVTRGRDGLDRLVGAPSPGVLVASSAPNARSARDALSGKPLDDAARAIAAAWRVRAAP
jgi:hypothetical protein